MHVKQEQQVRTLLSSFYKAGQKTLNRVDWTHKIPAEYRRLDAIARFLEYAQICVAVHREESALSIATNKLKYGDDTTSPKAELISSALLQLQQVAAGKRDAEIIYDRVFAPYGMPPLTSDSHSSVKHYHAAVNNWVACLPQPQQLDTIKALESLRHPLQVGGCRSASEIVLSNMTDKTINLTPVKYHDVLKVSYTKLETIHYRALQDQKKILHLLTSDEFEEIRDLLLSNETIELVFPDIPSPDGKDLHAEMNLMAMLEDQGILSKDKEVYLAISKLSCFGCIIDLSYLSRMFNISVRGSHAVQYPSRAKSKWYGQTAGQHEYYKPFATDATNDEFLFAENSDSDEEDLMCIGDRLIEEEC